MGDHRIAPDRPWSYRQVLSSERVYTARRQHICRKPEYRSNRGVWPQSVGQHERLVTFGTERRQPRITL